MNRPSDRPPCLRPTDVIINAHRCHSVESTVLHESIGTPEKQVFAVIRNSSDDVRLAIVFLSLLLYLVKVTLCLVLALAASTNWRLLTALSLSVRLTSIYITLITVLLIVLFCIYMQSTVISWTNNYTLKFTFITKCVLVLCIVLIWLHKLMSSHFSSGDINLNFYRHLLEPFV